MCRLCYQNCLEVLAPPRAYPRDAQLAIRTSPCDLVLCKGCLRRWFGRCSDLCAIFVFAIPLSTSVALELAATPGFAELAWWPTLAARGIATLTMRTLGS